MIETTLSAPFLGLPALLAALLLLALWVALSARAASNWSSLFGGVAALATVWLFGTVLFDKVWDALWLPKQVLGVWPSAPTTIATTIALLAGVWLERRLRSEELGPILTGVLEGCTPQNVYEWCASIGFLAFAVAMAGMLLAPQQLNVKGPMLWLGLAGTVATGGGLLAGGASAWRGTGSLTRGVLMALVGLTWCLAMFALGQRIEDQSQGHIVELERAREFWHQSPEWILANTDKSHEDRERWERFRAMWRYIDTGVAEDYVNASGETVLFEPDAETGYYQQLYVLMPALLREAVDNARVFQSLWPYVALGGLLLGLLRPRRQLPSASAG